MYYCIVVCTVQILCHIKSISQHIVTQFASPSAIVNPQGGPCCPNCPRVVPTIILRNEYLHFHQFIKICRHVKQSLLDFHFLLLGSFPEFSKRDPQHNHTEEWIFAKISKCWTYVEGFKDNCWNFSFLGYHVLLIPLLGSSLTVSWHGLLLGPDSVTA